MDQNIVFIKALFDILFDLTDFREMIQLFCCHVRVFIFTSSQVLISLRVTTREIGYYFVDITFVFIYISNRKPRIFQPLLNYKQNF